MENILLEEEQEKEKKANKKIMEVKNVQEAGLEEKQNKDKTETEEETSNLENKDWLGMYKFNLICKIKILKNYIKVSK